MNPQSLRILRPVLTSPPQLPSAPQILSPSGQHDKFSEITTACSTELGIPSVRSFSLSHTRNRSTSAVRDQLAETNHTFWAMISCAWAFAMPSALFAF